MVELFIRLNRIVIDRSMSQQADNDSSAVDKINRIYIGFLVYRPNIYNPFVLHNIH